MAVGVTIPTVGGLPVGAANPMPVASRGSTGMTASANIPTVATILASGSVLLATIAANANRALAFVENQSAGDLILVGDKGDDTQIWQRILTGVGAGKQGADWSSDRFQGRLRIYGATGARLGAGEF